MKHVSILIPEGDCSLTHIEASQMILQYVNPVLEDLGRDAVFEVQLVGLHTRPQLKKSMYTITAQASIEEVKRTDLILIPAVQTGMDAALIANRPFLPWLRRQYELGAELAAFCVGSFLLASTQLLEGRQCTTHWSYASDFRQRFPDAQLVPDRIITDDRGIYCSGGALSFQNLLVYLIEKYAGRDVAVLAAKTFMIDIDRDSQSPFTIFRGQKEHDDEPVVKAQDFIEKNFTERLSVDELASMVAVSRRNFERRFRKATANSVVEYIQRVRIEAAKKSLESTRKNVNEVMYEVGYNDLKAFRTVFKKVTGLTPTEYREKYNPRAVAEA